MLEIDSNTSSGVLEVRQSPLYTNICEVVWNGKTGANLTFRCNCTSTAFAPHKHGGEKGIHMRIQIDTYEAAATHRVAATVSFNKTDSNSECCNVTDASDGTVGGHSSSDGTSSLDLATPPASSSGSSTSNKKRLKDEDSFESSYGFNFVSCLFIICFWLISIGLKCNLMLYFYLRLQYIHL